ncbi:MAG: DNA methyltransferase, partial [Gemmatimonadota bacterium]
MAKRNTKNAKTIETTDYRHEGERRTNIPPAKIAGEGVIPRVEKVKYSYSPHLHPALRFDPSGDADHLPELVAEAGRRPLTPAEQAALVEALGSHQPWLEWAGKREEHTRGGFDVDPVALHIHERVSAQAIVRAATRDDVQRDLFADPQQPYQEAVQFYQHDMDWANRLILGDSLQVMSSLARREGLAGKVQMIYLDPPYGIKFAGNFQPEVMKRLDHSASADKHMVREPEMVRAYRDTWTLGKHSYLSYITQRLRVARELLADTGSIFVQINDENCHLLRAVLDETFGADNFVSQIVFQTTSGFETNTLATLGDYLLWYAKDATQVKVRKVFQVQCQQRSKTGHFQRFRSLHF